jgi:hypothetical protein
MAIEPVNRPITLAIAATITAPPTIVEAATPEDEPPRGVS